MKELIEIMNLQKELKKLEEVEPVRDPDSQPRINADQLEPLVKELRELIGVLKAERQKAERKGS